MAHSPSLSAKMQFANLNSNLIQWVWVHDMYISANELLTSLSKYLGVFGIRQGLPIVLLWNTLGQNKKHLAKCQVAEVLMLLQFSVSQVLNFETPTQGRI